MFRWRVLRLRTVHTARRYMDGPCIRPDLAKPSFGRGARMGNDVVRSATVLCGLVPRRLERLARAKYHGIKNSNPWLPGNRIWSRFLWAFLNTAFTKLATQDPENDFTSSTEVFTAADTGTPSICSV